MEPISVKIDVVYFHPTFIMSSITLLANTNQMVVSEIVSFEYCELLILIDD
eukprot:UN20155